MDTNFSHWTYGGPTVRAVDYAIKCAQTCWCRNCRAEATYLAVLPGRASGLVVLVLVSPRSLRAPRDVSRKRLFQQRPIRMDDDLPPRTLPNTCSGHGDVARVRQLAEHLGLGSAPGWVVSLFLRQPRNRRCCNVPCLCRRLASHTVCRIGDERKTIARMILA